MEVKKDQAAANTNVYGRGGSRKFFNRNVYNSQLYLPRFAETPT